LDEVVFAVEVLQPEGGLILEQLLEVFLAVARLPLQIAQFTVHQLGPRGSTWILRVSRELDVLF
jgi:hypothetical protein